ncbi:hypothetical protein ABIB57_002713 [Devosia sp. UYZn731]|uniref:hypothetical protein n=1 Tax=Devosia sp. UYZn731 TaxID=3156345 RepID=UPI003392F7CF
MKLWAALRDAWLGWVDIVRLRPGWQDRFGFSFGALAKALVIFFLFAFLAIAMGSVQGGMPSLPGLLANLLVQSLGLVALLIGIVVTKLAVKSDVPLLRVLVPGIYGMVFYLVAGSVLAAISIETVPIVLLGLVFLLYSLGRAAGTWSIGVALAFAVLTVVLLVGMPLTLYMLNNPAASPI